jgi:hypothetical protein
MKPQKVHFTPILSMLIVFSAACNGDWRIIPEHPEITPPGNASKPPESIVKSDGLCSSFIPVPAAEVATNENCHREAATGALDPVVEWRTSDTLTYATFPDRTHSVTTPVVGQLTDDNGDGIIDNNDIPDIVFNAYHTFSGLGSLRVISGDGSGEHWSADTQSVDGTNIWNSTRAGVAIGDLEGDGLPEIVTLGRYGRPMVFTHDGQLRWLDADTQFGRGTYPAITDMDGDGRAEVIFGRVIYDADGNKIGEGEYGTGFTIADGAYGKSSNRGLSFAADLDLDGQMEVVAGDALYRMDGSLVAQTGGPDGFPAVGNFDSDPLGEMVVVDGNSETIFLYDFDGKEFQEIWSFPIPGGGGHQFNGGPPTIADFDGDGMPEIGVAGSDHYIVVNHDGTFLWSKPIIDFSSAITGSSVFDFDRDGAAEVVYADEHTLWILDGKTGVARAEWSDHLSRTQLEYPVIADVDGDGHTEIIYVSSADTEDGEFSGVTVIGSASNSWAPARKIWNQHAYSITNVTEDGTIPTYAETNWSSFNTFRAGNIEPNLSHQLPDLVPQQPQFCLDDCQLDQTDMWVGLGNGGLTGAEPSEVAVMVRDADGTTTLLRTVPISTIQAGTSTLIGPIRLEKSEWLSGQIEILIDPDSQLDECDVANNTLLITDWPCDAGTP